MSDGGQAKRSMRIHRGTGPRTGPPVGAAFAAFAVAIVILVVVAVVDLRTPSPDRAVAIGQLAAVAAAIYAITGLLCLHRALSQRDRPAGAMGLILLGPGALWTWMTFTAASPRWLAPSSARLVVVLAGTAGLILLARNLRGARWLEVFGGLGLLALQLSANGLVNDPSRANSELSLVALAVAGSLTCLYGTLVEIEVSQHRTSDDLLSLRQAYQAEIERTEGLLHDLRSGLLSIEAAIGTITITQPEVVGPLRLEAARLRKLTITASKPPASFDLLPPVCSLIALKRAANCPIEMSAPPSARVQGLEDELLSVVENLVANAVRHGSPPVVVTIEQNGESTTLTVSDSGSALTADHAERIFDLGVTGHPEGSGIGLHRARLLARRNGAELELDISGGRTSLVLRLRSAGAPESGVRRPATVPASGTAAA